MSREPVQPTDPKIQLLRVVHGEADWTTLLECGFNITREWQPGTTAWKFEPPVPASIEPTTQDLAAGILRLRDDFVGLRNWADFIMCSDYVEVECLQDWPGYEGFIAAMWDLGTWADPAAAATLVRIAESIRDGTD